MSALQREGHEHTVAPRDERPLVELVSEIKDKAETLVQQEVALGLAELDDRAARISSDLKQSAAGGAVVLSGVLVLLAAATLFVAQFVEAWIAALLVGLAVTLPGLAMVLTARRSQKKELPDETILPRPERPELEGGTS